MKAIFQFARQRQPNHICGHLPHIVRQYGGKPERTTGGLSHKPSPVVDRILSYRLRIGRASDDRTNSYPRYPLNVQARALLRIRRLCAAIIRASEPKMVIHHPSGTGGVRSQPTAASSGAIEYAIVPEGSHNDEGAECTYASLVSLKRRETFDIWNLTVHKSC